MLSRVDGETYRVAAFKHGAELFLAKGAPVWEIVSLIRCSAQVG